jgi:hypothetical protein
VTVARRYCRLACIALCASACTEPDDVVAKIKLLSDAGTTMTMGSGGAPADPGVMQAPTSQCPPLPDWFGSALLLDTMGCRVSHSDPLVPYAVAYYHDNVNDVARPVGETQPPTQCDFDWPSPYYQDPAYPDDYTFCAFWCGVFRARAARMWMEYDACHKAAQAMPQQQP